MTGAFTNDKRFTMPTPSRNPSIRAPTGCQHEQRFARAVSIMMRFLLSIAIESVISDATNFSVCFTSLLIIRKIIFTNDKRIHY